MSEYHVFTSWGFVRMATYGDIAFPPLFRTCDAELAAIWAAMGFIIQEAVHA